MSFQNEVTIAFSADGSGVLPLPTQPLSFRDDPLEFLLTKRHLSYTHGRHEDKGPQEQLSTVPAEGCE